MAVLTSTVLRRVRRALPPSGAPPRRRPRLGIFDHADSSLGGGQLVIGHMAAGLSRHADVEVIHSGRGYSLEALAAGFDLDLDGVTERTVADCPRSFAIPGGRPLIRNLARARALTRPYDLFIYSGHGMPPFCFAGCALVFCHFPMEALPERDPEAARRWLARSPIDRRIRGSAYRWLWRFRMRPYRRVLTNSRFTAEWIERRWGRAADVLYPPVDLEVADTPKRNLIVSIGRFDGGARTKNQLGQVQAFRELLGAGLRDWRLVIIGSAEDRAYEQRVRDAASGLPITVLANADRDTVHRCLAEAKLFWHTTGAPAEEEHRPEAAEHFGIATVEAMRAGCVPVAFASGGQREIVEDGVSGILCRDLAGLVSDSRALVQDEERRSLLSAGARRRSRLFTRDEFDRRLTAIVAQCLSAWAAA
jgi:L-malate glycosyltransferase